jgi:hypothetical protein
MPTAKEEVRRILDVLPDEVSFEDIQYHIYVREKVRHGIEQMDAGLVIDQAEVEQRMTHFSI